MANNSDVANQSPAIIEIIKILIWPVLVFIIFLFIRKNIYNLIDRIRKIGHGKISIDTSQQQIEQKPVKSIVDVALGLFSPETIAHVETKVKTQTELSDLGTDSEKVERLVKYSVVLSLVVSYERLYTLLFGSQIRILQQLNTGEVEHKESIKRFYDDAVKKHPEFYASYDFDSYLKFLSDSNLIVIYPDDKMNISIFGKDFLKYLIDRGKQFDKQL